MSTCLFFFQAEDGIRALVRSRGLGDVYKRQEEDHAPRSAEPVPRTFLTAQRAEEPGVRLRAQGPVSYTHLTLPTSDLV